MKCFITLIFLIGFLFQVIYADATYVKPKFINNLNTNKQVQEMVVNNDEERTFETFKKKEDKLLYVKNDELMQAYTNAQKPSFVVLYNRLLDSHISDPTNEITITYPNGQTQKIAQKIYLPLNKSEGTLTKKELWILENNLMNYFNTNLLSVVDRSFLMRMGETVSRNNQFVREIEIKSLSRGADYLVEVLFARNKDFKIKVIKLADGQVIFSNFSPVKKKSSSQYQKSSNHDFVNILKKKSLEERMFESLDKLSESLVTHWKTQEKNVNTASVRESKQNKALGIDSYQDIYPEKKSKKFSKTTGTGFFISKDGYIITNSHVIHGANDIEIDYLGTAYNAKLISEDKHNDIALLKVDIKNVQPLILASKTATKGTEVCALGFPLINMQGKELKSTFGHINAISGIQGDVRFYQIDAAIQPGNSGGPLVNTRGEVVGIVSSKLNQFATLKQVSTFVQNVNYAIKIDYALPIINQSRVNFTLGVDKDIYLSGSKLVETINRSVVLITAL